MPDTRGWNEAARELPPGYIAQPHRDGYTVIRLTYKNGVQHKIAFCWQMPTQEAAYLAAWLHAGYSLIDDNDPDD